MTVAFVFYLITTIGAFFRFVSQADVGIRYYDCHIMYCNRNILCPVSDVCLVFLCGNHQYHHLLDT